MPANIQDIRDDADAINSVEVALSGALYELSFDAQYGHGSTIEAIDQIRTSRRHADRGVVAAATGNAVMAAAHEARAAVATAESDRMLGRAGSYADSLVQGLEAAAGSAEEALGHARSMVGHDDSSPAAGIHVKIAGQSDAVQAMAQRVTEIQTRIPGSRDPDELRIAAEQFLALSSELEEGSGRVQEIASDSAGYANAV